jgi:predicted nucleic acid-binding protein
MISSSSVAPQRGLDTVLLAYALLDAHPASLPCEQFIRNHIGWFLSTLTLFETKAILTKVYGVSPTLANQKLTQILSGPVVVFPIDGALAQAALQQADTLGIDLNDAVLLGLTLSLGASVIATEDRKLAQVCQPLGIRTENPIDAALQQQVVAWESAHLIPKGLPRILRRICDWLTSRHPQAAQDLWSNTGSGSHLP